ncbi:PH domain-containing protein [Mesonia maritima]|uniref:Uncharacterized protein YyaB-like PH domain-containing protein n=2 Tax=Mesonia maritima TaxID=1793873 RepID=A0ABU1K5K7_9FLAO|nr:PH domain-containing protein [Mesonia maritima]MDR6300282.1 hypothetical protein [Mesonia maritima]
MKFKSRKDIAFKILVLIAILFLGSIIIFSFQEDMHNGNIFLNILPLLVIILLLWIYFRTYYIITETKLIYRSGPIFGSILIAEIEEIKVGNTMWAGFKPATARNGLIIKYGKYNEIYISPDTNESFIKEILKRKNSIKISY